MAGPGPAAHTARIRMHLALTPREGAFADNSVMGRRESVREAWNGVILLHLERSWGSCREACGGMGQREAG